MMICRLFGHRYTLSNHPALKHSPMPLTCSRCGHLAKRRCQV